MSRFLDMADLVAARLEETPGLEGVPVVVDRQKQIATLVATAVGKARGACITILFEGFTNPDPENSMPRLLARYSIRIYSLPVIQQAKAAADQVYADDVVSAVAKALHNWWDSSQSHSFGEMKITGGDLVQDPKWLIYEIDAQVPLLLL